MAEIDLDLSSAPYSVQYSQYSTIRVRGLRRGVRRCGSTLRSMSSSSSSDEDDPRTADAAPVAQELLDDELSAATMAALQMHLQKAEESSSSDEDEDGGAGVSENFGMSQFWVSLPRRLLPASQPAAAARCQAPLSRSERCR